MNFKSWTIKTKLWFLVCGFLLNLSILGFIAIRNVGELVGDIEVIGHTDLPAIRDMTTIDMYHDGIRGIVYNAIIVGGTHDKDQMNEVRSDMEKMSKEIVTLLSGMDKYHLAPETKAAIAPAKKNVTEYVAKANEIVSIALEGKSAEAMAKTPQLQKQFKLLETDLEALGEKISAEAEAAIKLSTVHATSASTWSVLVLAIGFLFGLTTSYFLIRQLQNSLSAVASDLDLESQEVNSMASGLGESSVSLSSATHEQASAIQETAASIDEITAMVKKTGENSHQLETSTQASSEAAERGKQSVQEMLGAIDQIKDSNTKIMHQIEEGNKKIADIVRVISEIGNKTKVINDIVFQTKLLSFNASVEAARAGEHGKGFAVVAEEVGNLAQMSGNSVKEISDMLETSIHTVETIVQENKAKVESLIVEGKQKVELGVKTAGQCGASLDEIVNQSQQVARMVEEISSAIKEQSQGVQEISKAINLLDQATTQNSNTASKTSESSSRLVTRADKLLKIVGVVNQMIGLKSQKGANAIAPSATKTESHGAPQNTEAPLAEVKQFPAKAIKAKPAPKIPERTATKNSFTEKQAVGGDSPLPNREDPRFEEV